MADPTVPGGDHLRAIRLVCLDLAGTTVRDDGVVERAFLEALGGMGIDPRGDEAARHLEHVRATMGQSKIVVFRALFDDEEARAQDANRRFEAAYDAAVARGEIAPIPGADDAIARLRDAGLKLCFTTGFSDATRERVLAALGWHDLADLSLSPGPGRRGRPAPDLVLTAVMALGVDAVQQVAVAGDTASDVLAGRRAGASMVAGVLTGAHDRATLEAAGATHVLPSVVELAALLAP